MVAAGGGSTRCRWTRNRSPAVTAPTMQIRTGRRPTPLRPTLVRSAEDQVGFAFGLERRALDPGTVTVPGVPGDSGRWEARSGKRAILGCSSRNLSPSMAGRDPASSIAVAAPSWTTSPLPDDQHPVRQAEHLLDLAGTTATATPRSANDRISWVDLRGGRRRRRRGWARRATAPGGHASASGPARSGSAGCRRTACVPPGSRRRGGRRALGELGRLASLLAAVEKPRQANLLIEETVMLRETASSAAGPGSCAPRGSESPCRPAPPAAGPAQPRTRRRSVPDEARRAPYRSR